MRKTYLLLLLILFDPAMAFDIPVPGTGPIAGSSYILVDFQSGQVLAEKQPDERLEPASITKLMTAYIVFTELKKETVQLDEQIRISDKAYRMRGSRMFVEPDKPVSIEELLLGTIVQSGNDSSVALAEHIAGTEESFAELMNHHARRLGMSNTHYVNATGWPDEEHYSSARDIATLTAALIREFPEYYEWYSQKVYKYNGIEQYNRNTLLDRDPSVDGVKTGHTESAGYCLVSSASRDGRRLIAVVLGTASKRARADASYALLNYGFRNFETHALYKAGAPITTARVWKGTRPEVELIIDHDLYVTIPNQTYDMLDASMDLQSVIVAPVERNSALGEVQVSHGKTLLASASLYPMDNVGSGGLWRRAIDEVLLWFE